MSKILTLVAAALVGGLPAAAAKPADHDCALLEISAGRRPKLTVVNGNGSLELTKRRKEVIASLDGRRLPESSLVRGGQTLRIVGDRGDTLFMVVLWAHPSPDGQIIYAPDLDPASAHARLGLRSELLEDEDAALVGRRPGETLRVTGICAGGPGERAGLRENDLIVHVGEESDATYEALNRAVDALRDGAALRLGILRAGREMDIPVTVAPPGDWPEPGELETYVEKKLGS